MWIKSTVLLLLLLYVITAVLAIDEHRPKPKKDEVRGKRNLQYSVSHHYAGPHSYRLERRISTGPQLPLYQHTSFFPQGPRPYSSYHKGRPNSLPIPPYAVQMEPLVHYSQRDPLYDTNTFSLHTDGQNELLTKPEDLLTDTNHLSENIYGAGPQYQHHHQPHTKVIERPVYIKEPEPIIEIIIKESNVTLPPQPQIHVTPAPKKKEQVQVFYVKYKKNPHGHGKDSVIYDKPVEAISPPIHDDDEHEEQQQAQPEYHHHHHEVVTGPPPPSTTLRTIIKPDSEVYHSPSGIKVTFGKEGFDYHKRSSKPDEYKPNNSRQNSPQPQGRQLQSFPPTNNFYSRGPPPNLSFPPTFNYRSEPPPPPPRQPQPYRPFGSSNSPPPPPSSNSFKQPQSQYRQHSSSSQFPNQPRYPTFQSKPPSFSPSFSNNGPPPFNQQPSFNHQHNNQHNNQQFNSQRQPVPYQPFENLRPQPPRTSNPVQFRPETQFRQTESPFPTHQQLPLSQPSTQFNSHRNQNNQDQQIYNQHHANIHPANPTQPSPPQHHFQNQEFEIRQQQQQQQQARVEQERHNQQQQQKQIQQHQPQYSQQQLNQNNNNGLAHLQGVQNVIPPGGELIQSQAKYEQHISVVQPTQPQPTQAQALPLQTSSTAPHHNNNNFQLSAQQSQHLSADEYNKKIQEQFRNSQLSQNDNQQQQQILQQQIQQQSPEDFIRQQQQLRNPLDLYQNFQQNQDDNNQITYSHIHRLPDVNINGNTTPDSPKYQSTERTVSSSTSPRYVYKSTTEEAPLSTTEASNKPSTTTKDPKILNAQLPDEVPEDLRAQLLSSGILNNADISVLDYDKVGDIPLSALPPDQLANFYNAGGGQQLASAGSEPIPVIATPEGKIIQKVDDQEPESSEIQEVKTTLPKKQGVEMKVVHYDPGTLEGQEVQESYVKDDAKQIDPVVLNDSAYNRYLPLKVSGAQFPIPDVPELKGKKISSVVVLAPVSYDFSSQRKTRAAKEVTAAEEELIQGVALKELLKNPTLDNYKKFLESENKTTSDKQAVILLVTGSKDAKDKEIYMYDIATKSVSKLNGELSSAFVDAAEANAEKEKYDRESKTSASNIIETRVPYTGENVDRYDSISSELEKLDNPDGRFADSNVPIIDPMDNLEGEASEQLEKFVDISGIPVDTEDDLSVSASENLGVSISSSYSKSGQAKSTA